MEAPKEIGRGISGVVFYPALPCEGAPEGDYVSKLTTPAIAEKEMEFADIIRKYIPDGAIYAEYMCKSDHTITIKSTLYDTSIFLKYGGKPINTYIADEMELYYYKFEKYKDVITPEKIRVAQELLTALEELREQVIAMNKDGLFHNDIWQENIVYNETTKRAYLIDFEKAGYEPLHGGDEFKMTSLIDELRTYVTGVKDKMRKGGRKTRRHRKAYTSTFRISSRSTFCK